jgi:hypothetical protein
VTPHSTWSSATIRNIASAVLERAIVDIDIATKNVKRLSRVQSAKVLKSEMDGIRRFAGSKLCQLYCDATDVDSKAVEEALNSRLDKFDAAYKRLLPDESAPARPCNQKDKSCVS